MASSQPNYLSHRFEEMTEAGDTEPFLCEMGYRNFPSKHTVSWEFGGTVKPTSIDYTLQGTNKFDARAAGEEEWFDILGAVPVTVPGDGEPAPHLTYEDAVAKWIRIRLNGITGGTAPTARPTWAGVV